MQEKKKMTYFFETLHYEIDEKQNCIWLVDMNARVGNDNRRIKRYMGTKREKNT